MQSEHHVIQLSRGDGPAVHTYYDIALEEPGGDRILYFEFDSDQIPGPGRVIVADADGSNPQVVGQADEAIGHIGAKACWVAPGRVAWAPRPTQEDRSVIRDLNTGEEQELAHMIRSVNHVTRRASLLGGGGDPAVTRLEDLQAVRILDIDSGEIRTVLTVDQAHAAHPQRNEFDPSIANFQHPKLAPNGEELFIVFCTAWARHHRTDIDVPHIKSLMRLNTDGSNLRHVGTFGDHPMWTPDSRAIFANFANNRGSKDVLAFPEGEAGKLQPLVRNTKGGHPSISPGGRWLVTEGQPQSPEHDGALMLCDLQTGDRRTIVSARHTDGHHITGCHLHAQWSRDGRRIFFNSSDTGQPQVYALSIDSPL